MLELMLETPTRFLSEIVTLAEPGNTKRAPADRRVAVAGNQSSATLPRKRRRHDGLNCGKQVPLQW